MSNFPKRWTETKLTHTRHIVSQNKEQLQEALDIVIGLFERAGLVTNATKTRAMTCIPGKIRTRLSNNVYAGKLAGLSKK